MWYPASITTAAEAEPVTVEEMKRQLYIDHTDDDPMLTRLISAARDHAERYCGSRFATQTLTIKCDAFSDMARLPEGPIQSITSIEYVDTDGADQTLSTDVYEVRADGLDTAIVRKHAQQWPTPQHGSRITVTAVVGYATVPPAVKHAIILFVSDSYETRVPAAMADWTTFDSLLCNFRMGA
ncbi:head-tail connector protein [Aurantimonas sp. A2-1-M11]|uniref:head-tail connector protein n=1 Tax=Aurantimonas sp. A2-1-M11 TaxID=3113712 RepID=UPI002F93D35B